MQMRKKTSTRNKTRSTRRNRPPLPQVCAPAADAVVIETAHPRLMPIGIACRYGGFGRSKGYELIREHQITAVKLGRRTLIDVASLDAFLAALPKVDEVLL
jgi:excisionase family DNA binding protein